MIIKNIFCSILFLLGISVSAQFYTGHNLKFGKSRIQYENRIWSYYRTPVADIYYYPQSKELANFAAEHIRETIAELERKLGITIQRKMQIIIYARHSDFMQSNIGMETEDFYNTGGITPIYGDKIFLYFKGNLNTFLSDLRSGIAGLFVNYFMVGETIGSNISASYMSSFPVWFTDGLSAYLSREWSAEMDNQTRDGIESGRYKKIHNLSASEQQAAGFSLWKFIADRYGENVIPVILYYTSASRNYERAMYYTLRLTTSEILAEWVDYYHKIYLGRSGEDSVDASLFKYKKNTNYLYPKISPDGKRLAYVSNLDGRVKIWLMNLENNKRTCIYRSHYRIEDYPDYSYPLLGWHPSGNFLSVMFEYHDKVYFQPYLIEKKKFDKRQVVFINKITDFSYSSDGRFIALSGVMNGQSDIYLYNTASRSLEQITNDKADDYAPRFIHNNTQLVFSSNRKNDTIGAENQFMKGKYDLFLYDISTKNKVLQPLTTTPNANDIYAMEADENHLSFISDWNGINNRYLGNFQRVISQIDTGIHYTYRFNWYPVSNYNTGINFQDINLSNAAIAQQIFRKGKSVIGIENHTRISDMNKRELTPVVFTAKIAKKNADTVSVKDTNQVEKPHQKRLQQIRQSDLKPLSTDTTDENNGATAKLKPESETETLIPRNYDVQYFINSMVAQADFSFLNASSYQQFVKAPQPIYLNPGLNAMLMVTIRDLMEDYRMTGGVRLSVTLNNIEFLYSFEYLKRRLDQQVILHYQNLKSFDGRYDIRQQNAEIHYVLKYPFDRVNSLHTTFSLQYNRYDLRSIDDYSLKQKPDNKFWLGAKAEYIIDNTREMAINLRRGFRGKLFAEYFCTPDKNFNNMAVFGMDMRHYAKLHKTLIWANRFAASTSAGKNRLIYYMGGVDNWIFPQFNSNINIDTSVNYTFQTLATNMRGFTQNIRNGTTFVVINSELRFQIIQCFSKKPLRSEFLQSLQLVLFGDVGTAWVGLHPYLDNNALFINTIRVGDITVKIKKQTEPIVGGFGGGIRFQLFGYFIRFDYARGVENYKINDKGVFYLSFNLDF